MEVVRNSVLCRRLMPLWYLLAGYYEYSILAKVFRGIASGWGKACSGSVLIRFLTREGVLSRAWKRSVTCRALSILLNLPGALLRWVYLKAKPVFDGSGAARLVFNLVEEVPAAAGWLMLGILVIPYAKWNNGYALAGFMLLLLFTVAGWMRKGTGKLDLTALGPYLTGFGILILLSCAWSYYFSLSARFLYYHLACGFCVLVIVASVERRDQLMRLLSCVTTGLVVVSVYGVVQRIQGVPVNASYVDLTVNEGMPGRVFSMYENPNAFGEILVLLIPLAIALMLGSRGWLGRFWGFLGTALGSVSLAMTYSRAGWLGLLVAVFLFVLLWNRKVIPAVLILGVAAVPLLPDTVLHRILTIFNMSDTSTTSRFPLYQAAGRLLKLHPIHGVGLGSDAVRQAVSDLNLYHGKAPFVHCHDVYLQVWTETGILGLLAFLGSAGWTLKKAAGTVAHKKGDRRTRLSIVGGISAVIGVMICGIADYIWHYPRVMLVFWFVFALTLAGIRLAAREQEA